MARVVPTKGVAGVGTGTITRNAFLAPDTLVAAARAAGGKIEPRTLTFVSNAGGVEDGNAASDAVEAKIKAALGPLTTRGTSVEKAKQQLLDAAKVAGDGLGSFFLFIGSFSIIAGVMSASKVSATPSSRHTAATSSRVGTARTRSTATTAMTCCPAAAATTCSRAARATTTSAAAPAPTSPPPAT